MSVANRKELRDWFDMELEVINIEQVPKKRSLLGNSYFILKPKDVEALKRGKVLCELDEYGTFIMLDPAYRKELRDKEILKEMAQREGEALEKIHNDIDKAVDEMPPSVRKAILDKTQGLIKDAVNALENKDSEE